MTETKRPLLGISCCNRIIGVDTGQVAMTRYVTAAMRHGETDVVLIPALPELCDASNLVSRLDGILLTGSPSNVGPRYYGDPEEDAPGPFDPQRDAMMLRLVEAAARWHKPLFGICRGFQEINVAFGGTLRRDAGIAEELLGHHAPDGVPYDQMFEHRHVVHISPGGVLNAALGCLEMEVNSVHFQGVRRLGEGLTPEAVATDGLVEAFSGRLGEAPVLGVQWHPEWTVDVDPRSAAIFGLLGRALRGERDLARPVTGEG
ncbi:MAG TPA: gamma-glutamyl-gamma-aminobutyrate hydrolase family protein [Acetobacteraceae bacterium]|nr:gamma-glutamyl-gamma-aminobutyrate hydrolase family protein [Acetobacteraceae bacterium]